MVAVSKLDEKRFLSFKKELSELLDKHGVIIYASWRDKIIVLSRYDGADLDPNLKNELFIIEEE